MKIKSEESSVFARNFFRTVPVHFVSYVSGEFDPTTITAFVLKGVPGAKLVENMGTEITFQLPGDGGRSGAFEKLFNDLDANLQRFGISSYGISDTTLEEVSEQMLRYIAHCKNVIVLTALKYNQHHSLNVKYASMLMTF